MRVSNSHFERSVVSAPVPEPMPSGAPELPVAATRASDGQQGRSAQSARYAVERTPSLPPAGSVDEADARFIIEMRYQEYEARRVLDELFESGAAQALWL